jgi:outer membrane protein assembly factor BamB
VPTWGTPTVHQFDGQTQVICNGYKQIGSYDLASGEEIWKFHGGGDIPVPTPIVAHDLIYITNGHGMENPVYAIKPTAKGKIKFKKGEEAPEGVAYRLADRGTYMQTPICVGDYLYLCRDNGVLTCVEAKTGKLMYQQRLGKGMSGFTASPVSCGDKLYFTSEDGDIYVIQAGPEFKQLAKNTVGDVCMATPAISDGTLFVRTQKGLIAIAQAEENARGAAKPTGKKHGKPSNKPSPAEETELIKIALKHLGMENANPSTYKASVTSDHDGMWFVVIEGLPAKPGTHTGVLIDTDHNVVRVLPGA